MEIRKCKSDLYWATESFRVPFMSKQDNAPSMVHLCHGSLNRSLLYASHGKHTSSSPKSLIFYAFQLVVRRTVEGKMGGFEASLYCPLDIHV